MSYHEWRFFCHEWGDLPMIATSDEVIYHKMSNTRRSLLGNKLADHPDVVGASPVGAAPTTCTSSFSLNTCRQWIGQKQLQQEMRNIYVWGFGVPYIKDFSVAHVFKWSDGICTAHNAQNLKTMFMFSYDVLGLFGTKLGTVYVIGTMGYSNNCPSSASKATLS